MGFNSAFKGLNWLGQVERMAEDNIVQKVKRWKPVPKSPIGRPKTRWEDDVFGRYKERKNIQLEESSAE